MVDRVATLAWLAQEAAIELHPWTSRTDAADRPTYALIDIDPGTETSFEEVLVLARLYRTALGHLGVIGLPKVTGKRGVQIWLPVRPIYSFEQTRDWVESLSRAVGQMVPELVSWEWSKRDRGGRARLDFTPERDQPDAGGALLGATGARGADLGADQLGRARRSVARAERLDDAHRCRRGWRGWATCSRRR